MKKILLFAMIALLAGSCHKDPSAIPSNGPQCGCATLNAGTPNWPHGHWLVRYEITGATSPDSVYLRINIPAPYNPYYYKRVVSPSLPLSETTLYCGDLNSDIDISLWDHDTTYIYTCNIYVNNVLKTTVAGTSKPPYGLTAVAQCQ
jgi:hypothetical protein